MSALAQHIEDVSLIDQHVHGCWLSTGDRRRFENALNEANTEPLARAMEGMVRMYQNHSAREDTIVFPAWKKTMSQKQLDEIGEKFEDIEHQQFGKDGFEDAEKRIRGIEGMLGLTDLAQFTAPAPPKT